MHIDLAVIASQWSELAVHDTSLAEEIVTSSQLTKREKWYWP